ncbi:MAG: PD-(D/E)XK nuclease family protein [Chloroflexi bacterium]|nr:PD-(D/E)XK nuclease family protein [Chloroflexota bacterium]
MPAKTKRLPVRTPAEVQEWYPWHRQSLLADADCCMLRTKWTLEVAEAYPLAARMARPWDSPEAARGILAHRYAAEVLRTLWAQGNDRMPVAEALEILYETCAQRDVPDEDVVYIPARERRYLRMFAIRFVQHGKKEENAGLLRRWNVERLLAIEERFWASVSYVGPDGAKVKRTITGQPDAELIGGPGELVVLDFKSTPKAPAQVPDRKRDPNGDVPGDDATGNISPEGYFQQRVYGFGLLVNRPDVDRVTLREVYPMDPDGLQVRTATVFRSDLERIERELSITVELLDRAIAGGSRSKLWKPQPGKHCNQGCPRPGLCPIPREERGDGAITGHRIAAEWAAQFVAADGLRTNRRKALKAWHEQTGHPIPVGVDGDRYELRYAAGTRNFGMFGVQPSGRGPEDPNLSAAFRAAAERKRANP